MHSKTLKVNPEIDTLVKTQQMMQQAQLQLDQERLKDKKTKSKDVDVNSNNEAMQAGQYDQPENPLPPIHLDKPGLECEMTLKPHYKAVGYIGSNKLSKMVAIVTGGDSGIGRAISVLFAREGAKIAIIYLNEHEDAEQTAADVAAEGQECLLISGDIRKSSFCKEAVNRVLNEWGQIDILINNAAFQLHADSLMDISDERIEMTFQTNIYGYIYMSRATIPHLKEGSSIINTGSVAGLRGSEHLLDYSSTKGAVHAFTKALASNLLPKGIRVNAVAPGPVWTPLNPADRSIEEVQTFGANTDMKRVAQPEEIAPAYVFLAAPCCASYITGIILPISGSVGAM